MIYTEKSTDKYIMERMEKFMSKVAVVYWSGTGNTEAMATAVAEGAQEKGAEVSLMSCGEFGADRMDEFDAVAFGCPSMGAEQLEEGDFEPMFTACEESSPERRLRCLVLTDGATGNGCGAGRIPAGQTVRYLSVTASSAMRRRTGTRCPTVRLWARRWCREYGHFAQNDKLAFPNILVRMIKLE